MSRWKDIPRTKGRYAVSDDGQVKRNACKVKSYSGRIITKGETLLTVTKQSYGNTVRFCSEMMGGNSLMRVDALVASTFLKRPKGDYRVRHKDGDIYNDNFYNLEWVPGEPQKADDRLF